MTFLEHSEKVCVPLACLGTRAIRWAIRQLRFEEATISRAARQLGTAWNTVWFYIKPCLQAASDDPARFAGVRVLGVDEHVWHHQDRRHRGPRELTGIVDLTRGKDHPTARLLDLGPGRSGTVYKNWLAERGKDFRAGARIVMLDAFHIVKLAGDELDEVRRRVQQDTLGHHGRTGDPIYQIGFSCAPRVIGSRSVNKNDSVRPSRQMRHTSVSKLPTSAPDKCAKSSTKTRSPKEDSSRPDSSSAYKRVPFPRSHVWAGPYDDGRTCSTPPATPAQPASTAPKPSTTPA